MNGFPVGYYDANQNGINFLLTDLDLAMTFMDVAEISQIEETTRRNHNNARKAYDTVLRLLQKLTPDAGNGKRLMRRWPV